MSDQKAVSVVIGAGGGIGRALVASLAAREPGGRIFAVSREGRAFPNAQVRTGIIDIGDEESIRAAAASVDAPVDRVIVATGLLHEGACRPERALRELDPDRLLRIFQVNTIGPALALKHFSPLLARDRPTIFALLSAQVGSISDNRSGGWYGYRASKAALNMIVRCAAIELQRTRPAAICVGLHPGTVDTALSKPFQARVSKDALFTPDRAAAQLLDVMAGLGVEASGRCFAWDGSEVSP